VPRVLLLVPTATYRAPDFLAAARALGVDVVVAADEELVALGDRTTSVPFEDPVAAARAIEDLDRRQPLDAVVAVDDPGIVIAARAGERLGFPHNPPDAVATTRDKAAMRDALGAAEVPQPRYARLADVDDDPDVGWPRVVKPVHGSGSRGVIRADTPGEAQAAARRAAAISGGPLLAEEYLPGAEVAVEGLLRGGELTVLAVFDKPDPMEGPYFEETIYVTPSRLAPQVLADVARVTAAATDALGLTEGPVHAELRVRDGRAKVIEVAARSIGGLCARTLRLGAGISLEEVILRHALGLSLDDLGREPTASGVMMLPIPRSGTLVAVDGVDEARRVPGVVGLEITVPRGRHLDALPEGGRYLGFLFARGSSPTAVEDSLRQAHGLVRVEIA
jgi:biotin carboxylase